MKQNWDLVVLISFLVVLVIATMFTAWSMYDLNKKLEEKQTTTDDFHVYVDAELPIRKESSDTLNHWMATEQQNTVLMEKAIRDLQAERSRMLREAAAFKMRADVYTFAAKDAQSRGNRYLEAINDVTQLTKNGTDLNDKLKSSTEAAQRRLQAIINSEKTEHSKEMDSLQESLKAWDAREAAHLADFDKRSHVHAGNYSNLSRTKQAEESKLTVLTKQSEKEIDLKSDGKVIFSEPSSRMVQISLGRNNAILPGMRFEVYTERMGFRRVRKGFIEVIRVYQTYSECLAIKSPMSLPTDPLSEYVAESPEYQFSPFSSRGGAASPLTGVPLDKIWTVDNFEPVVAGDLVNNPFYNATRPLTFFFIGSTKIFYDKKDIAKSIALHGGTVVDKMSPDVDYVVAQAFQGPPTALNDAVQQGANILYEWELFPFLRER